jgi:hypothetical protein
MFLSILGAARFSDEFIRNSVNRVFQPKLLIGRGNMEV